MKKTLKLSACTILLLLLLYALAACACKHNGGVATCTEWGICTKCDEAYLEPIGHIEVIDEGVSSTCSVAGISDGKHCSVCNQTLVEQTVIPIIDHIEGHIIVDKEATIDEKGLGHYNCTMCGIWLRDEELKYVMDITVWMYDGYGTEYFFEKQIKDFESAYPGITINATVEMVSSADALTLLLNGEDFTPDIYCLTQDHTERFAEFNALSAPNQQMAENIKTSNDLASVLSASVEGQIYAYPLRTNNGYYMYYDKSVITNPDDLATIVADCERVGKNACFELENAWYTSSFFMATGCVSKWNKNSNGVVTLVEDTWNSPEGLIAMKGMQILTRSNCYINDSSEFTNSGIVISGMWYDDIAKKVFGDNYAVADLPSFTVDGESYHLRSYSGHILMGVRPQKDSKREELLHLLAQYLTGEECQLERYAEFQFAPTNLNVQVSEAVLENKAICALVKQNEYSIPQGNFHNAWWDIAKMLGSDSRLAATEAELQLALDKYQVYIDDLNKTDEELKAWSVIGEMCGTVWSTDFPMSEVSTGVYESDSLVLNKGDKFRCRRGKSWEMSFGQGGEMNSGGDIVVEESGTYIIRLEWSEGATTAMITLIPVE